MYTEGNNIIYDISIPDDFPVGFTDNMECYVNIVNKPMNSNVSFNLSGEEAKATKQLITSKLTQENTNRVTITPISATKAMIIFDTAIARKNKPGNIQFRADLTFDNFTIVNYQKLVKTG